MRPYYYLGRNRALTQLADGYPFFVHTRDVGITTWIVLGGTWEVFVDGILCGVTRAGDRVLDAGANQGYYSVRLGHIVGPAGRVTAFEPNSELFEVLSDNVDVNGLAPRFDLHRKALGERFGSAVLTFDYRNMGGGSLVPEKAGGPNTETVEVVPGDAVLPPDTAFDVMKFDIEGFEPLAALGLAGALERSRGAAIVLEASPSEWARMGGFDDVLARFTQHFRIAFEIAHDSFLDPLDLDDAESMTALRERTDFFYLLLLPRDHWAMNFVRSRCRPAKQGVPEPAGPRTEP